MRVATAKEPPAGCAVPQSGAAGRPLLAQSLLQGYRSGNPLALRPLPQHLLRLLRMLLLLPPLQPLLPLLVLPSAQLQPPPLLSLYCTLLSKLRI